MKTPLSLALLTLAVPALAQERPTLTVYTYDSFVSEYGPGPVIEERFEVECDCELELIAAGDGAALLGRVQLEGARSEADVVLGLDANLIARARETGLFAPYGFDLPPLDLPVDWESELFVPFDWGWFAFVYDETRLAEPPASFEALLAAPEAVDIIIQDPRTSTPGLGLLMWVESIYGEDSERVWEALEPRIVTVTKGWWEAYSAFLDGEAAMALSYTTSPAYHAMVEDDPTKKAAAFAEGHYLQVEAAGRLAATDQPELADRFLRFVLSEDFQSAIPTTNWMYPAVTPEEGLPEAFEALHEPGTSLMVPPEQVPEVRERALEKWRDALSG